MENSHRRKGKKARSDMGAEDPAHPQPLPRRTGVGPGDSRLPGGDLTAAGGLAGNGGTGDQQPDATEAIRPRVDGLEAEEVDYTVRVATVEMKRLKCPYCKTDKIRQYGRSRTGKVLYYRCTRCVYPGDGTMDHTRFKVVVVE